MDIEEIDNVSEFYTGNYTYITFQVFDEEQFEYLLLPLFKLIGVTEYSRSSGTNPNSGYANHSTPLITFKLPKVDNVENLKLSLGAFGNNILIN